MYWSVENPKEIKIDNIIQVATNNLFAMKRQYDATIHVESTNLMLHGNRTQLVQLFQNLISNGIKYKKPDEQPIIKVGKTIINGQPTLYVSDNGIGIKPAFNKKIFQIFNRLNPTDTGDDSSGVGLAICEKVVQQHDGRIWVESEEGKGATFYIQLAKLEPIPNDL